MALAKDGGKVKAVLVTGVFDKVLFFGKQRETPEGPDFRSIHQPYRVVHKPLGISRKERKKDIFLACFSPDGKTAWAVSAGGWGDDTGQRLSLTTQGAPLVAGTFLGSATFGLGEAHRTVFIQGKTSSSPGSGSKW